jgi:dTDP-glucose pyrophosphorylase
MTYYRDMLDFRAAEYLNFAKSHIYFYRDAVETILTQAKGKVRANRELYSTTTKLIASQSNKESCCCRNF